MAWRTPDGVHFASDSRLTLAKNSSADVGIKVLSIPYTVLEPGDGTDATPRAVKWHGELGMCFAGSAVNSFSIKESVTEIVKSVQYAPGYTDISMLGFANYIFTVYKLVSREVCRTSIGENGRAEFLVGGFCLESKRVRVFQFSTDQYNEASLTEVLTSIGDHVFVGSGAKTASALLPPRPTTGDFLNVLKLVIDEPKEGGVGGHVQYGAFQGAGFRVYGIAELGKTAVHYWRGAIDINSEEFMKDGNFIPSIAHINPFKTLGAAKAPDESPSSGNSEPRVGLL